MGAIDNQHVRPPTADEITCRQCVYFLDHRQPDDEPGEVNSYCGRNNHWINDGDTCSDATVEQPKAEHKWVLRTPVLTTLLLESANVQQLWRMWTEHTAAGQSLTAWVCVNIALLLWLNFYLVITPEAKWAIRGTAFGVCLNAAVILSVFYWRYF